MTPIPVPNCSFVLDNGQPCRAPARRGDRFCRHHDPAALARRHHAESGAAGPEPGGDSIAEGDGALNPWALRGYWRMHHRLIPRYNPEQLDDAFNMILGALADRQIAPTSAGRLLRVILDRRRALASEAQEAYLRALLQQSRGGLDLSSMSPGRQGHAVVPFDNTVKDPLELPRFQQAL